jgi:hypothetical protein
MTTGTQPAQQTTAVTGAMYIAGQAVFGNAGAFRAVDPTEGTALEPAFRFAGSKLGPGRRGPVSRRGCRAPPASASATPATGTGMPPGRNGYVGGLG